MSVITMYNGNPITACDLSDLFESLSSDVNHEALALFLEEEYFKSQSALQKTTKSLEEMLKTSLTDQLTGLPNRRACIEDLTHMSRISQRVAYDNGAAKGALERRQKNETAIHFLDLNNFKPINDTLGHKVGDEVLIDIANKLGAHLRRATTKLFRLGGDEFVIIEQQTDAEQAGKTMNYAKSFFVDYSYNHEGKEWPVGTSIGCHIVEHNLSPENNIEKADEAMYAQKHLNTGSRPFIQLSR